MKDDPRQVGQFAYSIHDLIQSGGKAGPLLGSATKALAAVADKGDRTVKPFLFDTLARLHDDANDTKAAIAAMEKALDSAADERQKKRLEPFLVQLKEKLKKASK